MKSFLHLLLDFVHILVHILTDTYKIFLQNGKLMALITLLIISFHSILDISNYFFSIKPLISDLMVEIFFPGFATPGIPEFSELISGEYKDFRILELIYILISSTASFFFATATTYAAAMTLSGRKLSIKALASTTVKLWRRPLVTSFYMTLLAFGDFCLCLIILITLLLIFGIIPSKALVITLAFPFVIIYAYITVVWELSFVASVLEEKSGIEALGKAANIVRGMQVPGFALNLGMVILSLVLSQSCELVGQQKAKVQIIVGVVVIHSISLVIRMFVYMAYTVMYLQCKKNHGEEDQPFVGPNNHGEEVELQGTVECTKMTSSPLIDEDIP
ncbi:hypothetical protein SLA2020_518630 [Shorea laevis]